MSRIPWLEAAKRELSEDARAADERRRWLAEKRHAKYAWLRKKLWLRAHGFRVTLPPWISHVEDISNRAP